MPNHQRWHHGRSKSNTTNPPPSLPGVIRSAPLRTILIAYVSSSVRISRCPRQLRLQPLLGHVVLERNGLFGQI